MKMKIYIFLLILIPTKVFSQVSYDTLTKVNDTSSLNLKSKEKGFELVAVNMLPCSGEAAHNLRSRISNIQFINETLTISVNFVSDCCIHFLGEIEIKNDSTINIIAINPGAICLCYCCYNLDYIIKTKSNPFKYFEFNNKEVIQSSVAVYNPVHYTLEEFYNNGNLKKEIDMFGETIERITYYNRNEIPTKTEHYDESGKITKIEYYKNGELIEK